MTITWTGSDAAQGYNVRWGIAPDKLYNSWLIYGAEELTLNCLCAGQEYFVQVEAFNTNGISPCSETLRVE